MQRKKEKQSERKILFLSMCVHVIRTPFKKYEIHKQSRVFFIGMSISIRFFAVCVFSICVCVFLQKQAKVKKKI